VQAAGAVAAAAAVPGALKSVLRFDKEITHLPVARTVGGKSAKGAEDAERYLAKGADNKAITGTSKADVFGPPSEVALAAGKKRPPQAKQVSPTGTAAKEKIDDIVIPPKATVEAETEKLAAQLKNLEGPGFQSPVYKDLNMTPEQKDVFARINGNPLAGRAPRVPTERLKPERAKQLLEAERASQEILDKLAKHWSNALPGRRGSKLTADQKAKALFNLLTKKPLTKGTVNSRVRELFYDQWRKRFNESIARDPDFIAALKKHAGIEFTPAGSGVTAFRVQALDTSGKSHWVDINWDHFIRHDDAVAAALNANNYKALVPTVDAANLAANLGLENQVLKEGIERYERMIRSNDPIPPRASSNSEFADYVDVFTDILDDG
jgi:hypothetical protein